MFVVVAVETEQLPVAAVWGIIVMVVVRVMNCELAQFLAVKLSTAVGQNPGEYFQRPCSVGWLEAASCHASLRTKLQLHPTPRRDSSLLETPGFFIVFYGEMGLEGMSGYRGTAVCLMV
jgi:hypothetical protein